ncbi:hypothetical protein HPB48_008191 [Haemaphysalis longicornis]|uniref:Fibronectin type-III domain-containing protein n=1 Tax=Haemaphysalis longicornis TaxID=44386 RepID=A0A9J6H1X1_HAELO|nr:hypothetical protein HPB48_008191 [Haemaphysalis longicornis]
MGGLPKKGQGGAAPNGATQPPAINIILRRCRRSSSPHGRWTERRSPAGRREEQGARRGEYDVICLGVTNLRRETTRADRVFPTALPAGRNLLSWNTIKISLQAKIWPFVSFGLTYTHGGISIVIATAFFAKCADNLHDRMRFALYNTSQFHFIVTKQGLRGYGFGLDCHDKCSFLNRTVGMGVRLEIFETMTDSGLRSELFISSTERSDGAVYSCRAENEFGRDERTSKLLVVEVPGQPQDVKVSETWSRSASVSWSPPYSGNSPVAKYVIQFWKDSGTAHRLQEVAVPGSQTSTLVNDLHPGSTYHLSILAENSVGVGVASTPVKLHTGEEEPSAAPTDFQVEARGPSTVRVSWKPPPPDEWNGELLGYYIGYKPTSSGQPYSYRTSEFRPNASHEFFLTGLQRGTEYAVIAKAYNAAGSGIASHELHVKTLDGDLPPPPKVFVSGTTHSSITVTWHQQFPSGVRGYVLHYRPEESNQDWKEVNVDSRTSSHTVSNLESGVLYQLYVSANNEYGTGDPSEIITVRTHKTGRVMQSPIFGDASTPLYLNLFIMIPVLASLVTIVLVVIVTCVCLQRIKRRPPQPPMQPPPGTMDRRSKQFAATGQPQMTSTTARHAEKAQQAAGEYTGLSQRYVEVQPPPLPADHPCALYPAPCATLPMTEELEAKMARHNVNQEMKTFLAQNRELPTLPIGSKACMSIKKDHMYESAQ